ncbi:MAG TPA: LysM peptidoglycan-binding domain-containing protein [Vicinamibacteria bacterium]|nr:LysM peptidoglycan-binding domain-containing protein [Vicinamibacteria bacterium]
MPVHLRLVLVISLSTFVIGCSSKRPPGTDAAPPPHGVVASLHAETIELTRRELERGETLAAEGRWVAARLAFDRALDLLLTIPGGIESTPEAKALYDEAIATIHEAERLHQARMTDELATSEPAEEAAVDVLTSEVSRMESASALEAAERESDLLDRGYDLPVVENARVQSIIKMFQGPRREWFQEALDRSGHYLSMFRAVFAEEGLPRDLVYLAMIESGFKDRAVSRAGARGIWQFISATGRLYGLRQDFWIDDRFDPEKATRAAARHLRDLMEEFDDWYLAMAAYNAGARRVHRAIAQTGSRDFWTISARRRLPRETRSYVPLILAAVVIAKDPVAYGFTPSTASPRDYDVVRLEHPVDLETAAQSTGTDVEELKRLNPELRRWVTPLDHGDYPLRVPKGMAHDFREAIAAIPADERVRFGTHVVRRGDTLSRIASRYGTTVEALASANHIRSRSLIHPGQVLTVPVPSGSQQWSDEASAFQRDSVELDGREVYVVRRGDTLGAIASSFRMSLADLRRLNGLASAETRIHPGQRLVVSPTAAPPSSPRRPSTAGGDVYVVREGDTLGQIAEAHDIGLSKLRSLNGLHHRSSRIYPGQKLVVRESAASAQAEDAAPAGGAVTYRIRRGDTLSTIARRFGVSIEDLRRWNRIESDHIVTGQAITIHASPP